MPPPIRPLILPLLRSCAYKPHRLPGPLLHPPSHPQKIQPLHTPPNPRHYSSTPEPAPTKSYTFPEISALATSPSPKRLLIDVREPAELADTGRIPGAVNMPLTSNPDAFYLNDEDFFDRFGFERPRADSTGTSGSEARGSTSRSPFSGKMKAREADSGLNADGKEGVNSVDVNNEAGAAKDGNEQGEVEEVIFYCKAGVRSRAAARMAREWEGLKVGQYAEGWMGWDSQGGKVER